MSITLAQLEQETARRVGPYLAYFTDRQVPNTATVSYINVSELRSNIVMDAPTDLWLLRRGLDYLDNPVAFDVTDRQRLVSSYDPEQGRIYPDRIWGIIPVPGEQVEFHHLNPAQELRQSVLAGLRRCFLPETVQVQPTAPFGGIDLTLQLPWLTDPWQVQRVRYGWLGPYGDAPFDTYTSAGHLILTGTHGTALPTSVWADAWRPAWSWVNGAESAGGPVADDDTLEVDLDYAAAAAHIEAWHHFPAKLQSAAAGSFQATREQAAQEFTRLANLFGPARPARIGFSGVFRLGLVGHGWVNGPW